jgi:hypothetical protein
MIDTTIPNTENALAIQYFLGSSPIANSQSAKDGDKIGKQRV